MKVLLTGASGFIGHEVGKALQQRHELTLLVRPGTKPERHSGITKTVETGQADLTDIQGLRTFLADRQFDVIVHIGAIRGGRKFTRDQYWQANVEATEQFIEHAKKHGSRLVFCSSVGVFGAIPRELPASDATVRQEDNYYHKTKIEAERRIQNAVLHGLDGVVFRPSITYGPGDYGFPYTLIKLVDKGLLFLPDRSVTIHLTDLRILVQAFTTAVEDEEIPSGKCYIVADREPVRLRTLADAISMQLRGRPYPRWKTISKRWFEAGERIAGFFDSELWKARFELISRSWFYDVRDTLTDLKIDHVQTVERFKHTVDWYKSL